MSTTKIEDRPLPFSVTTAFLQFFTLAMGTPKDVADITCEFNFHGWLTVSVYAGGYDSKANSAAQLSETIYYEREPDNVLNQCEEVRKKIDVLLASGRQIKVKRMEDQSAALIQQIADMKAAIASAAAAATT